MQLRPTFIGEITWLGGKMEASKRARRVRQTRDRP